MYTSLLFSIFYPQPMLGQFYILIITSMAVEKQYPLRRNNAEKTAKKSSFLLQSIHIFFGGR